MKITARRSTVLFAAILFAIFRTAADSAFAEELLSNITLEATGTFSESYDSTVTDPECIDKQNYSISGDLTWKAFWPEVNLMSENEDFRGTTIEVNGKYNTKGSCKQAGDLCGGTSNYDGLYGCSGTLGIGDLPELLYLTVSKNPLLPTHNIVQFYPVQNFEPLGSCSGGCDLYEDCRYNHNDCFSVILIDSESFGCSQDAYGVVGILIPSDFGKYTVNVHGTCNYNYSRDTEGDQTQFFHYFTWSGTLTFEKISGSSTTTTAGSSSSSSTTTTTTNPKPPPCAAEEIYGENSEQTELLRKYRDNVLSNTPEGQEIIKTYYKFSPTVTKLLEQNQG